MLAAGSLLTVLDSLASEVNVLDAAFGIDNDAWARKVLDADPVAWFRLNELSGAVAKDASKTHIADGTYENGVALGAVGAVANDYAATFDGVDDRVSVVRDLSFMTGPLSFMAWIKPGSVAAGHKQILSFNHAATYLSLNGATPFISVTIGGIQRFIQAIGALVVGNWYFVVGTWDGDKLRIYVNGALTATSASYTGVVSMQIANGTQHYIGYYTGGGVLAFTGGIDEAAWFQRALSAAEIAALYAQANPAIVTIAGKAAASRDLIAAINDLTVQTDLLPLFSRRAANVYARNFYPSVNAMMVARAIDTHYGGNGGLNRFLTANDLRVSPLVRKLGVQIDARNTFRDTVLDPVARYEGTGAGSGTFKAGSNVDTAEYGEAALEVVVETIGALDRTLRITVTNYDGTSETRDVVVPALTVSGTAFPVGAAGDRFVGVTTIVTVGGGGTAGDSFRVRSKVERVIV